MSVISSLGIGSGLDLGGLVDGLLLVERSRAEGPLNRRQFRTQVRLSALGGLKAGVSSLQSAVTGLSDLSVGRKVSSSAASVATATATADADEASYLIEVQALARAQSLATNELSAFTSLDDTVGEGTLTVSIGADSVDIEIAAGANSLRELRDAINASDADVHAAVVQDGSDYRLLLSSGVSGTAGEMTLTVSGTLDVRLTSADMNETLAAQDAAFRVNGLDLTASSNTVDDVLPGLTLELHGTSEPGQQVKLTVTSDTANVSSKLGALVSAYNALIDTMAKIGGVRPELGEAGPLVGDPALRSLQNRIGSVFSSTIDTDLAGNPFSNLVSIGVHTNEFGKAVLDADELKAALEQSEAGVEALVTAFAESFGEQLEAFTGSQGILSFRTDQLDAELKTIGLRREEVALRIQQIEARLRRRFTALDSLISQFQSTSTFLTQRLASIPTPEA